jgi:hypothetical protein
VYDEDTFIMINKNNDGIVILKGCLDGKMYMLDVIVVPLRKQIYSPNGQINAMSTISSDV